MVSVFLETLDDEDVVEGQTVYLTNSAGKKLVTLKVEKNRGTYADMKVISGTPKKSYSVLMPHQAKAAAKKPVKKAIKKTVKKPVKKTVKKAIKKTVRKVKPVPVKKVTPRKKVKKPTRVAKKQTEPEELEEYNTDSYSLTESEKKEALEDEEEVQLEPKEVIDTPEEPQEEPVSGEGNNDYKWAITTDVLTLAGIIYNFQLFSVMVEPVSYTHLTLPTILLV